MKQLPQFTQLGGNRHRNQVYFGVTIAQV
jgi:hypothetical protein